MEDLRELLLAEGAALVGYGDLGALPPEEREGLPVGVSLAIALGRETVAGIQKGPTAAYYTLYIETNARLTALAEVAARWLRAREHRAVPLAATNVGVDWTTLATRLPHKTVATRAGLGWIGKCALLITRDYGSAVRLATVLTDAPLPLARPINGSGCGDCMACVLACPAHAPLGTNWRLGLPREAFFDARACNRMAHSLSRSAGLGDTICGICIAACPRTRRYLGDKVCP